MINQVATTVPRAYVRHQPSAARKRGPERWLREPRTITRRLPDPLADRELIAQLFAGAEERAGRPLDPELAAMVYSSVEYLTRASGVLWATLDALTEQTARAVERRNAKRFTPLGRVTRSKVQAVLRVMVAAGWLAHERKTCRARVLVVHEPPSTVAGEVGAQLMDQLRAPLPEPAALADDPAGASTTDHCLPPTVSPDGLRVPSPVVKSGPAAAPDAEQAARVAAARIVDRHRDRLGCSRSPNPAGAWYRFLLGFLLARSSQLERAAVDAERAVAALAAGCSGPVLLSRARFLAALDKIPATRPPGG